MDSNCRTACYRVFDLKNSIFLALNLKHEMNYTQIELWKNNLQGKSKRNNWTKKNSQQNAIETVNFQSL